MEVSGGARLKDGSVVLLHRAGCRQFNKQLVLDPLPLIGRVYEEDDEEEFSGAGYSSALRLSPDSQNVISSSSFSRARGAQGPQLSDSSHSVKDSQCSLEYVMGPAASPWIR
uniref:Uncharacterized protein n=1 Tax=Knipowitschia caucasica TaxID=637954 RepID=A0AAV2KAM1_KNICA